MSDRKFLLDARALAHELRTPLAAALNVSALLPDSPEVRVLVQSLQHIADVLAEPSMKPGTAETLGAAQVVASVFERVSALAAQRGVSLRFSGSDATLFVDRVRVMQVLTNLVVNAVSHCAGSVQVAARSEDGWTYLDVQDDGPGLTDAQECARVFEPFTRLRADTPGQGMGLALCRLLTRACGGDVAAFPGPGGRFLVTLPADAAVVRAPAVSTDPPDLR